jgi:RHH-type proline utilization regulon transcriptional repressor/proline dehydrogenase/delta 1-pyrroline-5-carboxylate dehydrogenase
MVTEVQLNERVREIGCEIMERAIEARPHVWQKAWWLEQGTHFVERDEHFKTRSFQFVECLPALRDNAAIARHLGEYLDPRHVQLPRLFYAMIGSGPLQKLREDLIGAAARFGAMHMAGRFIAGDNPNTVVQTIQRLRAQGMTFTLDVLGESTTSTDQAERYVQKYVDLLNAITPVASAWPTVPILDEDARGPMPRVNLSVKLTSLDPFFDAVDPDRSKRNVGDRLRRLLRIGREQGAFVNIDMEAFRYRNLTFDLFKSVLLEDEFRDWEDVGIVVQAYLTDAEQDLQDLIEWGRKRGTRFAIRLVKGAYWDAETATAVRNYKTPPVWTQKWQSDACYERMTRVMLEHADLFRPAFASHNVRSLATIIATAEVLGLSPKQYELQTLYGMGDPLKAALAGMGVCQRVYLPCGALMPGMGYLIRRLLENTSNDGFLKQAFGDRASHQVLLADPVRLRPPSAPLPERHYQNTDPEEPMSSFTNASNTNFGVEKNRRKMIDVLAAVRASAGRKYPLIIDGQESKGDTWFDSLNPAKPSEIIGRVAMATVADADRAVAAAAHAARTWRRTAAAERADLLRKLADAMEENRLDLAATMILECGKPWREADADVTEAVDHCRYYAEQIERIETRPRIRNLPGEDNVLVYSSKGVCAVISPWAFPLAILTGMTSAALAAGNAVVIKPARQASVSAAKLVRLLFSVGFPGGTVNFLPGEGAVVGQHLVQHNDVQVVAMTGSSEVGTRVLEAGNRVRPGRRCIKKMIVEMGGKNAVIVDDDADLDGAVNGVIESAFVQAGQKCSSCSRVIVLKDVYEEFCQRLVAASESVIIGPAEQAATWVGPVIDEEARATIDEFRQIGRKEARLAFEAQLPSESEGGYYVPPTIFTDVKPTSRLATEEAFGPVLAVIKAKDFDHALKIANDVKYALTGGLYSRSPSHIAQARREFEVGNLYINRRIIGSQVDAQPFGGFKLSGTGVKAGSPDYLLHFMDARCITENTLRSGLVPEEEMASAR